MAKPVKNFISVIIPCYNSAHTITVCLDAILQSEFSNYEIIVVDDNSSDNTRQIVSDYDCQLISLPQHQGAGYARNVGAKASRGNILFFTDADCVLQKDTLGIISETMSSVDYDVMIGGTYTRQSYDNDFFSRFQSLFIHYSETKHLNDPDYIATHALAMHAVLFHQHDGFNNRVFPILEDVEYSHRLRRSGVKLMMNPSLQVQHIFNFSFLRSMQNAIRKSRFWTTYILDNQDLLTDSGTASHELKLNTLAFFITLMQLVLFINSGNYLFLTIMGLVVTANVFASFKFLASLYDAQDYIFTLKAAGYYLMVYPVAVSIGSILGIASYMIRYRAAREMA